jgi:hypothetical protein
VYFEATMNAKFGPQNVAYIPSIMAEIAMSPSTLYNDMEIAKYTREVKRLLRGNSTIRAGTQGQVVSEILNGLYPETLRMRVANTKPQTTAELFVVLGDIREIMKNVALIDSIVGRSSAAVQNDSALAVTPAGPQAVALPVSEPKWKCKNCKSMDHRIKQCPAPYCKACASKTHGPMNCPKYPKKTTDVTVPSAKGTSTAHQASTPATVTLPSDVCASMIATNNAVLAYLQSQSAVSLLQCRDVSMHALNSDDLLDQMNIFIDSGCNHTYIHDEQLLINHKPTTSQCIRNVSVANGQLSPIVGTGEFLGLQSDLVPSFANSLVSTSQFNTLGNISLFDVNHMYGITNTPAIQLMYDAILNHAKQNNLIKLFAANQNGLYKTSYNQIRNLQHSSNNSLEHRNEDAILPPLIPTALHSDQLVTHKLCQYASQYCGLAVYHTTNFKSLSDLVLYFHNSWGHMSKANMITVVTKQSYKNIPVDLTVNAINKYFPLCASCTKGNLAAVPLPHQASASKTYAVGECFEVDVKGPYTDNNGAVVQSFDKCVYSLTFKDVASKKVIGYTLKHIDNLVIYIEKVHHYINSKGFQLKILRTDNGLFTKDIKDYCTNHQIELQSCIPHEHGQIGTIERVHRTIEDMIVKMLHDKPHLTNQYWAMAYHDCLFQLNLIPVKSMDNKCPYEIWEHKPLDLHVTPTVPFGTIVMAHIPVKLQHALGGRALETIAVGSTLGYSGGVLLFNPRTKKQIVRRSFKTFGDSIPETPTYTMTTPFQSLELEANDSHTNKITLDRNMVTHNMTTRANTTSPPIDNYSMLDNNRFTVLSEDDDTTEHTDTQCIASAAPIERRSARPHKPRVPFDNSIQYANHGYNHEQWNTAVHESYFTATGHSRQQWNKMVNNAARTAKACMVDVSHTTVIGNALPIPRSYSDALLSVHAPLWIAAKSSEMQSFIDHKTYTVPTIPISDIPKESLLPSKIILDVRYNPDGTYKKCKFRLCARGDYIGRNMSAADLLDIVRNDTNYAGNVKSESVRILLSIAAEKDLELESWDVKTAFLYPPLAPNENIYMRRPKGLTDDDMPAIVKLNKCIYGLPQASAYFRKHIDASLIQIGMTPTISDPCVYTMTIGTAKIYISTHVDDLGVAGTSLDIINTVKSRLAAIYELSVVHDMSYYLGIHIVRDRPNRTIFMSQPAYIAEMLNTYNIDPEIIVNTPLATDFTTKQYNTTAHAINENDIMISPPMVKQYMQKVGSLLYLAIHTRPDILYAVTTLSRFCREPTHKHMNSIDRVLQYISSTKHLGLTLHSGEGVVLYGTVDASYACHKDLKSHTGCTLHIGKSSASVLTLTKKQTITADSSTVAEYIAAHLAAKQIIWARNFLSELGFPQNKPTILFEDNQSTISLINNAGNGSKTKHIDLRYNFIREQVTKMKNISIEYLRTEDMTSDMLTKVTGPNTFLHLRPLLLGASSTTP